MFFAKWWLLCPDNDVLAHWGRDKMVAISQTTYSSVCSSISTFELSLRYCFIKTCSLVANWQYVIVGSDNGLVPIRWHAIILTYADTVQRRIYALLGHNVLIQYIAVAF